MMDFAQPYLLASGTVKYLSLQIPKGDDIDFQLFLTGRVHLVQVWTVPTHDSRNCVPTSVPKVILH